MCKQNKTVQRYLSSAVAIIAVAAILVIIGIIFKNTNLRLDCTEDKLYTLSNATKTTLKELDKKLTIRFYYSKDVAQMPVMLKNYAKRVDDMLTEYEICANGNIRIEKLNPKPDTDAEDSANLDGVTGQGSDALGLEENIYLGIAIRSGDQLVALPFLSPEREALLEYDITRAIITVTHPVKHKVGILSSMRVFGGIDNPNMMMQGQGGMKPAWLLVTELKKEYDVSEISMSAEEIPADIDLLVAIHPKEPSQKLLYAIDQFVLRGGRLIAFLDPMCVADIQNQPQQQMAYMPPNATSTLGELLTAWGVDFNAGNVVIDRTCATQIQTRRNGPPEVMPNVLSLDEKHVSNDDPATAQLTSLLMLNAGSFTGTPAEGLNKTVLITSSDDSTTLEKFMTQRSGEDMLKDFRSDEKKQELAIRLTGTFKTAFPNGLPEEKKDEKKDDKADDKKEEPKPEGLKESAKPGAVILLADADMIYDPFCVRQNSIFGQTFYQPLNNNLALVQNLVEALSGDARLFEIRSRGVRQHPFTRVREMEKAASDKYKDEIKKFEQDVQSFQRELYTMQKQRSSGDKELLSKQQKEAVAKLKKKEAEARKNLKAVRKDMRKEIESLENNVMLVNIGLMPLLVILGGIALAISKRIRSSAK